MEEGRFREILQFAIDKEVEAFQFYTQASQQARYSGGKELFMSLAKEEEGHRKLLENLNMEKIAQKRIEQVPDLHISDYMVEVALTPDLSYADILRIAMKREEKSLKLYTDMKESHTDEALKKLFEFLASEEAKHKLRLEKIYDDEILR
ncbi:MAG: ferritin family protein [Desulfobacterota bacterium]|nr:ferritin family protein [Thermodesulfobacteriota bacterium]